MTPLPRTTTIGLLLMASQALTGCELIEEAATNAGRMCALDAFEVDTTDPGDDPEALCRPDAPCTLRAALNSVAFCNADDTKEIHLQAGAHYALPDANTPPGFLSADTAAIHDRTGTAALPVVFDRVRIEGRGATVSASAADLLLIVAEGGVLDLQEVTLEGRALHNAGELTASIRYDRAVGPLLINAGTADLDGFVVEGDEVVGEPLVRNDAGGSLSLVDARFSDLANVTAIENDGVLLAEGLALHRVAGEVGGEFGLSTTGVLNGPGGQATIYDLDAEANTGRDLIRSEGNLTLYDGRIADGDFSSKAAGVRIDGGTAGVFGTRFEDNTGRTSGGIWCGTGANIEVTDVTAAGNRAEASGGGGVLFADAGCWAFVSYGRFTDNAPTACAGPGDITGHSNDASDGSCP